MPQKYGLFGKQPNKMQEKDLRLVAQVL